MTAWALESADPERPLLNKGDWLFKMQIEKADETAMTVSGFASVEEVDKQGDLIVIEAFEKAIERLKEDNVILPLDLGHTGINIGKVTDIQFMKDVKPRKFWIKGQLNKKSKAAREAMSMIAKGKDPSYKGEDAIRAFSIGGSTLSKVRFCDTMGCINKVDDIELYHVALVGRPANEDSLIMAIKGALPPLKRIEYIRKQEPEPEEQAELDEEELLRRKKKEIEDAEKGLVFKPMAEYSDFADCVSKNQDKDDPEAYCGYIMHMVEGKGEEATMSEQTKEEQLNKEQKPVAAVAQVAASPTPTTQPSVPSPNPAPPVSTPPPAPPAPPVVDYEARAKALEAKLSEFESKHRELATKIEAWEAQNKLSAKVEAAPATQAPAGAIEAAQQPDRKGVVQGGGPLSGPSTGVSVLEMARQLNERKAPLVHPES